ncbi:hypothetical protein Tco_0790162 [Tanacetum coccineum]
MSRSADVSWIQSGVTIPGCNDGVTWLAKISGSIKQKASGVLLLGRGIGSGNVVVGATCGVVGENNMWGTAAVVIRPVAGWNRSRTIGQVKKSKKKEERGKEEAGEVEGLKGLRSKEVWSEGKGRAKKERA